VPFPGESARPPEAFPSDCLRDKKRSANALRFFGTRQKNNPAIRIAGFKVCINQEEEVDTEGDITTDNIGTGGSFSSSLAEAPYLPGELRR